MEQPFEVNVAMCSAINEMDNIYSSSRRDFPELSSSLAVIKIEKINLLLNSMTIEDVEIARNIQWPIECWQKYLLDNPIPVIAEISREEKKISRERAVSSIQVTVSTGKVFDGDEDSQNRMARAIIGMNAVKADVITWTLADNSVVAATLAELTEALVLSGKEQANLWPLL